MKNNILKTFTAISSTLKRSNFGIFPPEAKFCCCTFLRMPPLLFPDLEQGGAFLTSIPLIRPAPRVICKGPGQGFRYLVGEKIIEATRW